MRVRTDDRRRAILAAASDIFREQGYKRASMNMIAARLGWSKTTLYGYFPSKEELFASSMTLALQSQSDDVNALLDVEDPDIHAVLLRYAAAFYRLITSSETTGLMRTAVAEGVYQEIGPILYELGPKRTFSALTEYLATLHDRGRIRDINPKLAASHFGSLLEAGHLFPLLLGAEPEFTEEVSVPAAVDVFISYYVK